VQGGYDLVDLGSSNGTRVGEEDVVGRRRLQDGDRLGVGSSELTIAIPPP
jgi:pSer/pThr/pTyr-binding forkhead associated (FHA) protein